MLDRLVQPGGSSNIISNKQAIGNLFSVTVDKVIYLSEKTEVVSGSVLFDEESFVIYNSTGVNGIISSFSKNDDGTINLVTSTGSFNVKRWKNISDIEKTFTHVTPELFKSLQDAVSFAVANSVELRLQGKTYTIESPLVWTGTLIVRGMGSNSTRLLQTSGSGVFVQTLSSSSDSFFYEGFTIETTLTFNENNKALTIDGSGLVNATNNQVPGRTRPRGIFRDIRIAGGADRNSGIGFGVAFDLISIGWYDASNISIVGCANSSNSYSMQGIGVLQRGGGYTVETNWSELRFYNLNYAFYCPDYTEGVFIDKFNFVNVVNGIILGVHSDTWSADSTGKVGVYQPSITNGHINCSTVAILLSTVNYSTVDNVFLLLDDHGVTTTVQGVHIRTGQSCSISNLKIIHYAVNGTTGVTRQGVIFNAMSDSFIDGYQCLTAGTQYENITSALNTVNSSNRNHFSRLKIRNANTAITNGAGCANNVIENYRFDNVTTTVTDSNGDLTRLNHEARSITFSPEGAQVFTVEVVPNSYFSRTPRLTSSFCTPNTVPLDTFPDYDSSTPTSLKIVIRPSATGATLPNVTCRLNCVIHD